MLAACGGGHAAPDAVVVADAAADAAPDPGGYVPVLAVPVSSNPDLDLLFVVEDAPGMRAKQQRVAAAIGTLTAAFDTFRGGRPRLHIGVASSDMGTAGAPAVGACSGSGKLGALLTSGAPVAGAFITDTTRDAGGATNVTGPLVDALATMLALGEAGCDFPQPFAAMAAALQTPGFARPGANLAVVFVGDRDDCSAASPSLFDADTTTLGAQTPFRCFAQGVQCMPDLPTTPGTKNLCAARPGNAYVDGLDRYVGILNDRVADPDHQLLVAALGGPVTPVRVDAGPVLAPSCTFGAGETAQPAVRLLGLTKRFAEHAFASLCGDDAAMQVAGLTGAVRSLVGDPCVPIALPAPVDCIVDDVVGAAHATVPACGGGGGAVLPCWRLVVDAAACPGAEHLELVVDRGEVAAFGTVEAMRCRI